MNKLNNEMPWDKFNETELKAIGIEFSNLQNGTTYPTFPYIAVVLEELAETLVSITKFTPSNTAPLVRELQVIREQLLKVAPIPKTKDLNELMATYSEEEVANNLLACNVCHFMAKQLGNIQEQIIFEFETMRTTQNNQAQGGQQWRN
ncbi:hypothetical protein A1D22_02560 [Pasteurellaceae bacterium LFhippo2]|nr:hypothetical protein [Pasteurellaceae bacterium LFhippo2]